MMTTTRLGTMSTQREVEGGGVGRLGLGPVLIDCVALSFSESFVGV